MQAITAIRTGFVSVWPLRAVALLIAFVVVLNGCGRRDREAIKEGMDKNAVIRVWGEPSGWYVVDSTEKITLMAFYAKGAMNKNIPSNEVWLFEYKDSASHKFHVLLKDDKIIGVVDGPVLREKE